jgi:hypothetical protein
MSNIVEVSNGNEIPLPEIYDSLKTETYAAIRGIIDPEEVVSCVTTIKQRFSQYEDNPPTGESPSDIMTNFQKLATGGESKRYNNFPRFFRTLYNPIWADDIYGMRSIFRKVSRVRNLIYGLPEDFAIEGVASNGYWTASRIHQYPAGGGFFIGHRDTTLLDVAKEKGTGFFQVIIVMSKKGEDFDSGGAFIDGSNGERLNIDDSVEPGDIVVYDGQTFHGVEDIDPHRKLSLNTINGRLAGFVSLYKKMD